MSEASKEPPPQPLQWFRAKFVGDYFGSPNPNAPKAPGRRLSPHVYRIEAREVVLLSDVPAAEAADDEADADCWQARIDEAHLPHVLGPGTAYRGPVFDVQLRQIRLSCPIQHGGRAYGRIEGSLRGAFVMPEKPAIPAVKVRQKRASEPALAKPLEATLSLGEASLPRVQPSTTGDETLHVPSSGLRGLAAFMMLVCVALAVQSGPAHAAFWALCAAPILPLRWMFHELVRSSTLVRATALIACLGSLACAVLVVHAFRSCAPLPWWPALVTLLLLVPLAPMPSSLPAVTGLLCLALIVGLFSAQNHRPPCSVSHALRSDLGQAREPTGKRPELLAFMCMIA